LGGIHDLAEPSNALFVRQILREDVFGDEEEQE
jgi:hypothetical protein